MQIIFLLSVIALAGWVSITMLIRQFKMVRYHYDIKSSGIIFHLFLMMISPLVFVGIILFGLFLIYSYEVITTGQF